MRGFLECKGQSIRLEYDRDRAGFVLKAEPHPFVVRKPSDETRAEHKNGNMTKLAGRAKC
jgi:hypothetical protein